ncbi:MAG TPA: S8 family peptidase [Chitinophagales bacterium]|nr:S8 family peptidase [Chitinophagales bacterium]
MKEHIFILTLLIFIYGSSNGQFYYSFNEKVPLHFSSRYSIQFDSSSMLRQQDLIQRYKHENLSHNIILFEEDIYQQLINIVDQSKILSSSKVYLTSDSLELIVSNEISFKYKNPEYGNMESLLANIPHKVIEKGNRGILKVLEQSVNTLELANKLFESGLFEYCYPNFISKITFNESIPNDSYFEYQFYLKNTGQLINDGHFGTSGADIKATYAWDITKGNSNTIIAVIDQGVTSDHSDLPNSRQIRLNGSNFSGNGSANDPSPINSENHGNACAGIIAATQDNNEGISGICPNCKIMPIRIFGSADHDNIADAIEFAYNNGANIISNSWGYQTAQNNLFPVIINAINDAISNGSLVVFAAGNTANHTNSNIGYVMFPANINVSGMICVGASNRYDTQANYSPTSNLIEVVAPSHNAYSCQISGETFEIWTIDIPGNNGYNPWYNPYGDGNENTPCPIPIFKAQLPNSGTNYLSYTGRMGGTSAACPQVAAVAGLILSVYPCLTPQQIEDIIKLSAAKVSYVYTNERCNQMGFGRLDAEAALQRALDILLQNKTETGSRLVASMQTIRAGANVDPVFNSGNYVVASGANVEFKATESITLEDGFIAEAGSFFLAHIEPFNDDCEEWNTPMLFKTDFREVKTETFNEEITVGETKISPVFFPNPYNSDLYVKYALKENKTVRVQVYDIAGKLLEDQTFNGHAGTNIHKVNTTYSSSAATIAHFCINGNCETFKLVRTND